MADTSTAVSGAVTIHPSSKEHVAYKLMETIVYHDKAASKDKKYYLSLYVQCLKATSGSAIGYVLKDE